MGLLVRSSGRRESIFAQLHFQTNTFSELLNVFSFDDAPPILQNYILKYAYPSDLRTSAGVLLRSLIE